MAQSNGFNLGQLLGPRSVIQADQLAADAGAAGVTTYTSIGDLPSSGLTSGDMAFVDSSDRLYIWTGAGWYNIAVVNQTPAIQSILDSDGLSSPFTLSNEGATTTITMIAADPDGFPVSYIAVADSDFNAMATLSQVSNVFTITPTAIENSTGTITFKASDGINLASEISTFTLSFSIPDPDFNSVSFLSNFNGADNGVNNTFIDGSTSAHAITANGNVTQGSFGPFAVATGSPYDPAVNGASAYFDGTGDYLATPATTAFALGTQDFCIETWYYPISKAKDYPRIVNSGSATWGTNDNWTLLDRHNDAPTKFSWACVSLGGNSLLLQSSTVVQNNTWYHLAVTRSESTFRLFVNGVIEATYTNSGSCTSSSTVLLRVGGNGAADADLNGYISNFRVVNGTAVYTGNFTPPTAPLTAITNTKLLLNMANGQAIDGTAKNNLTLFGNAKISSTQSKFGGTSLYLGGTGDYAIVPNGSPAYSGNHTMEFWMYANSTGQTCAVLETRIDIYVNKLTVWLSGGVVRLVSPTSNIDSPTINAGQWYHIAVVRNSGIIALYIDGVSMGTASNTTSFPVTDINIGRYFAGGYEFNGFIDDLRITEGTARYTSNFTPPTEPFPDLG